MLRYLFFLIFVSFFLSSCTSSILVTPSQSPFTTSGSLYATGITDAQKIKLAIDRKKELRSIRKGDYMTLKNNPEAALLYYKAALEQLPNDIVIRRKIAHAYYLTRNWNDAYNNYAKVPLTELKESEYKELFQSLFFDDVRPDRNIELVRYQLDRSTRDYYQIIDTCYSGIHNCITSIEAYTGSSTRIIDIKNIIWKSTKISEDYQYRNFLVTTELYRQSSYRAVDILTREILTKRPNYTEVQKLRGFALFELGKYTDARDILLTYLEANPKDIESISRLGEIYVYLGDYSTSNLYLNNALTEGYSHKTEIERRLAYNYAALGNHAGMLKVLSYLLQESDVMEDDYAVAISLALSEGENMKAYAWAYTAIDRYPNSSILIPLYLSTLRFNGKSHEIPEFIQTLSEELKQYPLIQLEYANSLLDTGDIYQALPIFMAIRDLDPGTDWGIEAAHSISSIQSIQNQSGSVN